MARGKYSVFGTESGQHVFHSIKTSEQVWLFFRIYLHRVGSWELKTRLVLSFFCGVLQFILRYKLWKLNIVFFYWQNFVEWSRHITLHTTDRDAQHEFRFCKRTTNQDMSVIIMCKFTLTTYHIHTPLNLIYLLSKNTIRAIRILYWSNLWKKKAHCVNFDLQ